MCELPGLLITSSFLDSQLLLLRLRLSFITTNFLSSSPRETNICQNILHNIINSLHSDKLLSNRNFLPFWKRKALMAGVCTNYPSPLFLHFFCFWECWKVMMFFSNSSRKAGICQYVGRWNQNSATFVVLESRSGGLYARLSPFNLHNILSHVWYYYFYLWFRKVGLAVYMRSYLRSICTILQPRNKFPIGNS